MTKPFETQTLDASADFALYDATLRPVGAAPKQIKPAGITRFSTSDQRSNTDVAPQSWPIELEQLLPRFSHLNLAGDIGSMSVAELHGIYLWLHRLHRESQASG